MTTVRHHRDGTRTVTFRNGRRVTFGKSRRETPNVTGTPYIFAAGSKIDIPSYVAHGTIFKHKGQHYVALRYRGTDRIGRSVNACYGQPITLTRS